jgi:hypothetical protein
MTILFPRKPAGNCQKQLREATAVSGEGGIWAKTDALPQLGMEKSAKESDGEG